MAAAARVGLTLLSDDYGADENTDDDYSGFIPQLPDASSICRTERSLEWMIASKAGMFVGLVVSAVRTQLSSKLVTAPQKKRIETPELQVAYRIPPTTSSSARRRHSE